MKSNFLKAFSALLAGAHCVLGVIRTEELLPDGTVHVMFSNLTDTPPILNDASPAAPQQTAMASRRVQCKDSRTYWDYWWYGAGPVLSCGNGQRCTVVKGEGLTIGSSITGDGAMALKELDGYARRFRKSYNWSASVKTIVRQDIGWTGPMQARAWVKMWFAVTEATCRLCDGGKCSSWGSNKGWIPCADWSCYEYSVSDAYGKCDLENHCQL